MRVIETAGEMREARRELSGKVGLVATLGGMHAGHEAHLEKASELADVIVGSLFLNPAQFVAGEDYESYPHDREQDLAVFERHGAEIVFAPPLQEMYPPGDVTRVHPGPLVDRLEGRYRPGHFIGVATVVAKIFSIIRPDLATFGEKDAQQLRIIRNLNRDLRFGVEIVPIPTVREPDGLALSTRNRYLEGEEREAATVLYHALLAARVEWDDGVRDGNELKSAMTRVLRAELRARVDYVSVANPETLDELEEVEDRALVSLAVHIGKARLIDNITLGE